RGVTTPAHQTPSHEVLSAPDRERTRHSRRPAAPTITLGRWAPRAPPLLFGVLEFGSGLQGILGGSWQHEAALLLFERGHRYSDVMLAHSKEPADADNRVGHLPAGRHDQVVDVADLGAGVVVDVLPQNLLLCTPADCDFAQLCFRDGDQG